jgi:hypothetical protein
MRKRRERNTNDGGGEMKYKIELEGFCENIFHEMERLSAGNKGHEFVIEAGDKDHAADLTARLLTPFLFNQLMMEGE